MERAPEWNFKSLGSSLDSVIQPIILGMTLPSEKFLGRNSSVGIYRSLEGLWRDLKKVPEISTIVTKLSLPAFLGETTGSQIAKSANLDNLSLLC